MWQMQTPARVEELCSPPYVAIKNEDDLDLKFQMKSTIQPPVSTLRSL
jgi:hypothetical protein